MGRSGRTLRRCTEELVAGTIVERPWVDFVSLRRTYLAFLGENHRDRFTSHQCGRIQGSSSRSDDSRRTTGITESFGILAEFPLDQRIQVAAGARHFFQLRPLPLKLIALTVNANFFQSGEIPQLEF